MVKMSNNDIIIIIFYFSKKQIHLEAAREAGSRKEKR
jgi:hypothetical protein